MAEKTPKENHFSMGKPELMEKLVSLCKRRGFVYQGSEIYGGLAGTWDYGPLGVALKNNIKNTWWKMFVTDREDMYGMDAAILMNQKVWEASGHVGGFSDPMVECQECNNRFRVDNLLDNKMKDYLEYLSKINKEAGPLIDRSERDIDDSSNIIEYYKEKFDEDIEKKVRDLQSGALVSHAIIQSLQDDLLEAIKFQGRIPQLYLRINIPCPHCSSKNWGTPRRFNMMFKTHVGASEDATAVSYLRPETAQGMFVNFKNILDTFHPKLPFGMGQIGKAFRNEIAPRDFLFRVREFEQMEVEYFVREENWESKFNEWYELMKSFADKIGISEVHELDVPAEDRAHYSKKTIDFEFDYPSGRKELWGLAYRTNYDLSKHIEHSGVKLEYFDEESGERFVPHVIEPSLGVDRTLLAVLTSCYTEDELGGEKRVYLKFPKEIAPVRVAVFPLLKNKPELVDKARSVYKSIKENIPNVVFDDNGNIGKRYRRQDEIGTPYCVTIDFDTLEDDTVTLRDRDTGEQKRVKIEELKESLA